MNKSFLKFITDFGPLLIFFTIYYKSGNNLTVAIPPLIIATLLAVGIMYFVEKKVPYVPLVGGVVITLFGGLTLYFNNPVFIYMKPTIVNIIFAGILITSKIFFQKNFLKIFLQTAFQLNETGWDKLNFRWAYFFIFLAVRIPNIKKRVTANVVPFPFPKREPININRKIIVEEIILK